MSGKFLVSRLPFLMLDKGIKNVAELAIVTGIENRRRLNE